MAEVVVIGGSGFVGSAVCRALARRGSRVTALRAPRIVVPEGADPVAVARAAAGYLGPDLAGAGAVVNAAGLSDAGSSDSVALDAANALVPMAIAMACAVGGTRLVHVSSAAVQGRHSPLDDSDLTAPLTPYAASKAAGERFVRRHHPDAVIYRPPGVHGVDRAVTRSLVRLARSRASSVAAPGDGPAPHALIDDVADAVAFLALHPRVPPPIVNHPATGLSTASLLRLLGDGREPLRVPRPLAHAVIGLVRTAGRWHPGVAAQARRLEVLWCGQEQAPSWLTEQGWQASSLDDDWRQLGRLALQPAANRQGASPSTRKQP